MSRGETRLYDMCERNELCMYIYESTCLRTYLIYLLASAHVQMETRVIRQNRLICKCSPSGSPTLHCFTQARSLGTTPRKLLQSLTTSLQDIGWEGLDQDLLGTELGHAWMVVRCRTAGIYSNQHSRTACSTPVLVTS